MEAIALIFVVAWLIAFPFVYGFGLSRLFGLTKTIDRSILFVMHISVSSLALFSTFIFDRFFKNYNITVACSILLMVLAEGLVWQFFLKDRKMNGFLASLICNAVFFLPIAIAALILGFIP